MKFSEFNARITNINKFVVFLCQNNENHRILRIPLQNHENHENGIIQRQNNENHKILTISRQNYENHLKKNMPRQNNENHEIHRILF